METIAHGGLDSQTAPKYQKSSAESQGQAEKSRQHSKPNSPKGKAGAGTPRAAPTPNDLEVALSILQSAFDQALEAGLKAKLYQMPQTSILTLELWETLKCHKCEAWTTQAKCPACGNQIM